jgi:hypothetical protein
MTSDILCFDAAVPVEVVAAILGSPLQVKLLGRGVDLTTLPVDEPKLGRLGRLAVDAWFQWVFFEDVHHIHASMAK